MAGLNLVLFGLIGLIMYLGWRYGRYPRDASGVPTLIVQRPQYRVQKRLIPALLAAGCVGVVVLIVAAVTYLIQA